MEELAAYVCQKLDDKNYRAVLSGGCCMEIYTKQFYSSFDLDFVMTSSFKEKDIADIMKELGFKEDGKYFVIENSKFFIEIINGPVALGDQFIKDFARQDFKLGTLKLLTATDSIKDRLCACVFHGDNKCFEHALAIGHLNEIDEDELKRWSLKEDKDMQTSVNQYIKDLSLLNNPTNAGKIKYLKKLLNNEYLDINSELDHSYIMKALQERYMGKTIFLNFTILDIQELLASKESEPN
jgi:hypothetical protein